MIRISCLLLLLTITFSQTTNCDSVDPVTGCITCSTSYNKVMNLSSSKFGCTLEADCISILVQTCVECQYPSIIDVGLDICDSNSSYAGCKKLDNGNCIQCLNNNYVLDSSGICVLVLLDYCWTKNSTQCTQCTYDNLLTTSNCSVSSALCSTFDYVTWTCTTCPTASPTLHSSGTYCVDSGVNCLVYSPAGCLQCQWGYYLQNSVCTSGMSINLYTDQLSSSYPILQSTSSQSNITKCKAISQQFTYSTASLAMVCQSPSTNISYCKTQSSTTCSECLTSFYLSNNFCLPCLTDFCLSCSSTNCQQCVPGYYLVYESTDNSIINYLNGLIELSSNVSKCLECEVINCKYCSSVYSNSSKIVVCYQCLQGYKLVNGNCIDCSWGLYYDVLTKSCLACDVTDCYHCNTNSAACDVCRPDYVFDGTSCIAITTITTLTTTNANQTIAKLLPLSTDLILNDQTQLVTQCSTQSNGYSCLCNSNSTLSYSSSCQQITTTISSLTIPTTLITTTTSINHTTFLTNLNFLRLLSQLPQYAFTFSFVSSSTQLLSLDQFGALLQIYTNRIRYDSSGIDGYLGEIYALAFGGMKEVYVPFKANVISGPGYYFKYSPAGTFTDITDVATTTQQTTTRVAQVILILFNSTTTTKRLTGTAYVFLQNTSQSLSLTLKKISTLLTDQQYSYYLNQATVSLSSSTNSEGFVTLSSISSSTSSSFNGYFVSSSYSASGSTFDSVRIQNIFFQDSFIYILIFLTLYLFLIPMCALTDCVDNKTLKRKQSKQTSTYSNINNTESAQRQSTEVQIIRINYKDFFPIYNIANTSRPKRFVKLCLFLVNMQHGITFLTLIYFNLQADKEIVAVLLSIPAYLCTVIMGYICGILVVNLPGNFKYLINIFTLSYWILWVAIMSKFISQVYKPFVFIFAIIFLCIDLLVDLLQTLLMYFTIKQEQKQIRIFRCLSKWLSYRGYYEFDQMAKQIRQARQG